TIGIEPAPRDELDSHSVEEAFVDLIDADIDLLGASGRDESRSAGPAGGYADVGSSDGHHARDALHLIDNRLAFVGELLSIHVLNLEDVVPLIAGIDRARVNGLTVDDRRADDEADRDRELQ